MSQLIFLYTRYVPFRLLEDLDIANGKMAPGRQKDMLSEKMTLFTEIEKTKKQILSLSVEKEKLKTELKTSRTKEVTLSNSVQSMQSKLDAAHLANAAVRTAVLSAEIQKLNTTINQLKEQAHISSTEKSGLIFELESMKDEVSDAERKSKQINDLIEGKIQAWSDLQKSKEANAVSKTRIENLQGTVQDLHDQITRKDEEITVCKSVAFVNTKKTESDKAAMQLKLQSSGSKLDAISNRLDAVLAENSALEYDRSTMLIKLSATNTKMEKLIAENKEMEEQKALSTDLIISSLTDQLNAIKMKAIDEDTIASKFQSDLIEAKKNIQDINSKSDEKDIDIMLYDWQMKKTIAIIHDLNKKIEDFQKNCSHKYDHFDKKMNSTNNNLLVVEMNSLDMKTMLTIEKRRNLELKNNNKLLLSEHETQINEFKKSENSAQLVEKSYKNQKAELYQLKVDLENAKNTINQQTLDYDAQIKTKNNDFKIYLKELDPLQAKLIELKSEKETTAKSHDKEIAELRIESGLKERKLYEEIAQSKQEAENSLQNHEEELLNLYNTIESLQSVNDAHVSQISKINSEIEIMKKKSTENQQEAEAALIEYNRINAIHQKEKNEIEKKLFISQESIQKITEREATMKTEIETMKSDLASSQKEIEKLQLDIGTAQRVSKECPLLLILIYFNVF